MLGRNTGLLSVTGARVTFSRLALEKWHREIWLLAQLLGDTSKQLQVSRGRVGFRCVDSASWGAHVGYFGLGSLPVKLCVDTCLGECEHQRPPPSRLV